MDASGREARMLVSDGTYDLESLERVPNMLANRWATFRAHNDARVAVFYIQREAGMPDRYYIVGDVGETLAELARIGRGDERLYAVQIDGGAS